MCSKIFINNAEIEIETPREFIDFFGKKIEQKTNLLPEIYFAEKYPDIYWDNCLCEIDLRQELDYFNIPYTLDNGDFYIGKTQTKLF